MTAFATAVAQYRADRIHDRDAGESYDASHPAYAAEQLLCADDCPRDLFIYRAFRGLRNDDDLVDAFAEVQREVYGL